MQGKFLGDGLFRGMGRDYQRSRARFGNIQGYHRGE